MSDKYTFESNAQIYELFIEPRHNQAVLTIQKIIPFSPPALLESIQLPFEPVQKFITHKNFKWENTGNVVDLLMDSNWEDFTNENLLVSEKEWLTKKFNSIFYADSTRIEDILYDAEVNLSFDYKDNQALYKDLLRELRSISREWDDLPTIDNFINIVESRKTHLENNFSSDLKDFLILYNDLLSSMQIIIHARESFATTNQELQAILDDDFSFKN